MRYLTQQRLLITYGEFCQQVYFTYEICIYANPAERLREPKGANQEY